MRNMIVSRSLTFIWLLLIGILVAWSSATPQLLRVDKVGGLVNVGCCDDLITVSCPSTPGYTCTSTVYQCDKYVGGSMTCWRDYSSNACVTDPKCKDMYDEYCWKD